MICCSLQTSLPAIVSSKPAKRLQSIKLPCIKSRSTSVQLTEAESGLDSNNKRLIFCYVIPCITQVLFFCSVISLTMKQLILTCAFATVCCKTFAQTKKTDSTKKNIPVKIQPAPLSQQKIWPAKVNDSFMINSRPAIKTRTRL